MPRLRNIITVTDTEVCCTGSDGASHVPQRLSLPPGEIVSCPLCRLHYRSAPGGQRLSPASWPKAGAGDRRNE